jgi:RNA polymerase sigma-70 factor (ECF subfamily)
MTAFFRRARKAPVIGLEDGERTTLASIEPDPEYLITLGEEQRLLMKAVRRLPIDFQVVIELNYWEGITCNEIATILQVPSGTVRRRLQRGRAALEKNLAALADSPVLLAATTMSISGWQRGIRAWITAQTGPADTSD